MGEISNSLLQTWICSQYQSRYPTTVGNQTGRHSPKLGQRKNSFAQIGSSEQHEIFSITQ